MSSRQEALYMWSQCNVLCGSLEDRSIRAQPRKKGGQWGLLR